MAFKRVQMVNLTYRFQSSYNKYFQVEESMLKEVKEHDFMSPNREYQ